MAEWLETLHGLLTR